MFCSYCGAPIAQDAKFCMKCGKQLPQIPDSGSKQQSLLNIVELALAKGLMDGLESRELSADDSDGCATYILDNLEDNSNLQKITETIQQVIERWPAVGRVCLVDLKGILDTEMYMGKKVDKEYIRNLDEILQSIAGKSSLSGLPDLKNKAGLALARGIANARNDNKVSMDDANTITTNVREQLDSVTTHQELSDALARIARRWPVIVSGCKDELGGVLLLTGLAKYIHENPEKILEIMNDVSQRQLNEYIELAHKGPLDGPKVKEAVDLLKQKEIQLGECRNEADKKLIQDLVDALIPFRVAYNGSFASARLCDLRIRNKRKHKDDLRCLINEGGLGLLENNSLITKEQRVLIERNHAINEYLDKRVLYHVLLVHAVCGEGLSRELTEALSSKFPGEVSSAWEKAVNMAPFTSKE
jgi:zinc-ribbon domain